ncbi:hypothetical protein [Myroides marinus]|uniref:hypothetical protein n=1 Tax=Myroides marinus TaxID=703342 RepID=UPI002576B2DF|nr:hypothetical protein [Myroides marinus]MDM1376344.1 hypothetical protein [Myroides marinus]MDM1382062.1 hypothetical protein [Myroides marinus]
MSEHKYIEITIIDSNSTKNEVYKNIQDSVNTYLIKNKGAVSDFNLIKDIVDRNTDAVEEEISTQVPIPLYLGLMGTMLGIVFGLFMIPSIASDEFSHSVDILIGGVKIAMIASFVGLVLTTVLSGWLFKGAKNQAESLKNGFFSWTQTSLLPVLSQNTTSSLYSLQSNLVKFNDTFSENVTEFRTILGGIQGSFQSQIEIMEELKKVDVVQLANINVNVLKELKDSSKQFAQFQEYLNNVNGFIDNTKVLNSTILDQLHRTKDFTEIAEGFRSSSEANKEMIHLIRNEITQIQDRKKLLENHVIDIDSAFNKAYTQFNDQAIETFEKMRSSDELNALKAEITLETGAIEENVNLVFKTLDKTFTDFDKQVSKQIEVSNAKNNEMLMIAFNEFREELIKGNNTQENSDLKNDKALRILLYVFAGTGSIIGLYQIYKFIFN